MTVSPSERFYEELPAFDDFAGITEARQFRPLPPDWHVVVADIDSGVFVFHPALFRADAGV